MKKKCLIFFCFICSICFVSKAQNGSIDLSFGQNGINIPDTVGYNLPHQFGDLIKNIIEGVNNSDKAIFSVHCHNDLGLAVGNSLSAFLNAEANSFLRNFTLEYLCG